MASATGWTPTGSAAPPPAGGARCPAWPCGTAMAGARAVMPEERKTLTRYTIESEHRHPGSTGDFSGLLNAVATAVKIISNQVGRGALAGTLGSAGVQNVHGELQKKSTRL